MSKKTIQISFFIILTFSLLVFSFYIFKPYLGIFFLAAVFAVAFYPIYEKFLFWFQNKSWLASTLTTLIIMFLIVIPTIFIFRIVLKEAISLYDSVSLGGIKNVMFYIDSFSTKLDNLFLKEYLFQPNLSEYFQEVLNWIIKNFDSLFRSVFKGIFDFILLSISIYYMLKEGKWIKAKLVSWSPLPEKYDEEIISVLKSSIDAVFRGRFLISIAQGFFMGLGFYIFGISNPALWGFVGGIASLVPILGTSMVTVPAVAYLFFNGEIFSGIGMLLWGALAVGLVDDLLALWVLKKGIKINPLVILFSILGGVQLLGPLGFLAGPIVVSFLFSLLRIYPFILSPDE